MNINDFHKYINQSEHLNASTLAELQDVLETYPYFQTVHILYLKSLFNQNNFKFNNQLKYSSVHVNNRKKLLFYLKDKTRTKVQLKEIEVETEPEFAKVATPIKHKVLADDSDKNAGPPISTESIKETEELIADNKEIELTQDLANEDITSNVDVDLNSNEILEKRLQEINQSKKEIPNNKSEKQTDNKKEEGKESKSIDKIQAFLDNTTSFEPIDDSIIDLSELIQVEAPVEYLIKESIPKESPVKEGLGYWVNYLKNKEDSKKKRIVDDFLKNKKNKTIRGVSNKVHKLPESIKSNSKASGLMTETLAEIYMQQGHYEKALAAYEKLSLKNPKKNTYFANQIKKIKKLQLNT